jgi:helicase MOV-10
VIVLAGDHQQLGPTVRSPLARERGFGVSYLERLYRLPMYDAEAGQTFVGFHAPVITKLLRTYR